MGDSKLQVLHLVGDFADQDTHMDLHDVTDAKISSNIRFLLRLIECNLNNDESHLVNASMENRRQLRLRMIPMPRR